MSTQRHCDRCGKHQDEDGSHALWSTLLVHQIKDDSFPDRPAEKVSGIEMDYELCHDCTLLLVQLLKGKASP